MKNIFNEDDDMTICIFNKTKLFCDSFGHDLVRLDGS